MFFNTASYWNTSRVQLDQCCRSLGDGPLPLLHIVRWHCSSPFTIWRTSRNCSCLCLVLTDGRNVSFSYNHINWFQAWKRTKQLLLWYIQKWRELIVTLIKLVITSCDLFVSRYQHKSHIKFTPYESQYSWYNHSDTSVSLTTYSQ